MSLKAGKFPWVPALKVHESIHSATVQVCTEWPLLGWCVNDPFTVKSLSFYSAYLYLLQDGGWSPSQADFQSQQLLLQPLLRLGHSVGHVLLEQVVAHGHHAHAHQQVHERDDQFGLKQRA